MCRGASMNFSMYTSAQENAAPASVCACARFGFQFRCVAYHPHAASAAAGRCFDDDGIADLSASSSASSVDLNDSLRSGQNRHAGGLHRLAGELLQAHGADHFRLGADELDAGGFADFGEVGVLAEKAVAGVNGFDVGDLRRADDRRDIQIAARALGRPDADRLVGEAHVQRIAVGFGIHGDRPDAEIPAGADDAEGDLAAIGDQDLSETC